MPIDRRPVALTEDEFLNAVRDRAEHTFNSADGTMTAERIEVLEHYAGDAPPPFHPGSSKYVSPDVQDAVDKLTSNLQEAFGAGSNIVQFAPVNAGDVSLAAIATVCVEDALFRKNEGFEIFGDVIKDAALFRTGVAKAYWEVSEDFEEMPFEGTTDQLRAILVASENEQMGVEIQGLSMGDNGMVSATLSRPIDTSQVRVIPVPPEEFVCDGRTRDMKRMRYVGQRTIKTLGELIEMNYDPAKVWAISDSAVQLEFNEEAQRRHEDTMPRTFLADAKDAAGQEVLVYESYMRIDREGNGYQSLWMVVHAGDQILASQKVRRHPFVAFNPLPMPHRFHGENFAARVIPMANVKTTMVRGVTDNLIQSTNPRFLVKEGSLKSPRELLENRLRGIVTVSTKGNLGDSIAPLPQLPINPYVPQLIEHMDVAKEASSGITRLSQGLNKDALSNQNSGAMVDGMVDNSQVPIKVMARRFAVQFLKELVLLIHEIMIDNATKPQIIEIAGEFAEVTPAQWASRSRVTVDLSLGYNERDKAAQELLVFHKMMKDSQSPLYGIEEEHRVLSKVLKTKGRPDVQTYLKDPKTIQPPAPDPETVAKVKKLEVETQGLTVDQQIKQLKVQFEQKLEESNFMYQQQLDALKSNDNKHELDRKDRELDNRIDISQAESLINSAIFADPATEKKASAISSPNS